MAIYNNIFTVFSSFTTLDWLIYAALAILLAVQIRSILRVKSLSAYRLRVRLGLTILLWVVLLLFIIQPQWKFSGNTNRVLLISENIPAETIQKAKDSLKITESFTINDFNRRASEDPGFVSRLGSIYLLGQDFTAWTLSQLSQKKLHWLPSFKPDELQEIRWKAIVRKGEFQEVIGKVQLTEPKVLRVKYGSQVVDSFSLSKGFQTFQLRFPAFAVGRTETSLELENQEVQKVKFYSRKSQISSVYFILENPDFESKTLAELLGKNGNRVEILTTVAKNTQSKVSINRFDKSKTFTPDIIITEPSNVAHPLVKKAVSDGKSVLFFSVTSPEQSLKNINATLGTKWRVKKISNAESLPVGNGVTALPFQLEENINQNRVTGLPVAVQKVGGRVGVSLLNETFSLKLSGDSLAYGKIWSTILQQLNPPLEGNIEAEAPLWKDTKSKLVLNKFSQNINELSIANDTAQLHTSGLNSLTATADYIFRKSGWQPFQDSLEVYVEEESSPLSKAKQIKETLIAHAQVESLPSNVSEQMLTVQLPDWVWFALLLVCLTGLWIEPKLKY
ncbi:hypothetical protein [Runella sp.]|uniref:hypothetical protein n=1 Tax=Runella sp. TaxID=1960881 RepID=UPI002601EB53|nr:hypothetical protein [Runella sp.]